MSARPLRFSLIDRRYSRSQERNFNVARVVYSRLGAFATGAGGQLARRLITPARSLKVQRAYISLQFSVRMFVVLPLGGLSLPKSFQFCAGGAADISRWRQPPESPSLLICAPAGVRDRSATLN